MLRHRLLGHRLQLLAGISGTSLRSFGIQPVAVFSSDFTSIIPPQTSVFTKSYRERLAVTPAGPESLFTAQSQTQECSEWELLRSHNCRSSAVSIIRTEVVTHFSDHSNVSGDFANSLNRPGMCQAHSCLPSTPKVADKCQDAHHPLETTPREGPGKRKMH